MQDSISYSGSSTSTDHKLVKANLKLEWWRLKTQHKKVIRLNIDRFRDLEVRSKYREQFNIKLSESRVENEHPNISWKRILTTCKEVAKNVIGLKKPNKGPVSSTVIDELSEK